MHVLLPLYNHSNAIEQVAPGVFELRPGSPPRQGLTPPLPPWQGLWPSGIDTAWASVLPSHPAADTRVKAEQSGGPLETLERVTVRGRGIHGQEPTYCVLSRSLSYSVNHSVTTSHTLPPSYLLVHLLHSNLLGQIFTLFFPTLQTSVASDASLPSSRTSQQLANTFPQPSLHAQFNQVNYTALTLELTL